MFVSRKNLSLIHFFPAEVPAGFNVTQTAHERLYFRGAARPSRKLNQPLAKQIVQSLALRPRDQAACSIKSSSALKVIFFTIIVYTNFVLIIICPKASREIVDTVDRVDGKLFSGANMSPVVSATYKGACADLL